MTTHSKSLYERLIIGRLPSLDSGDMLSGRVVVQCALAVYLIELSVSVGGFGLWGRVVKSPPPLLKGYNVGSESQAQSSDFFR